MKFLAFVLLPMLFCFYKLYEPIIHFYWICHRIKKLQYKLDQLHEEVLDLEEVYPEDVHRLMRDYQPVHPDNN